eukprot:scaffold81408_cov39-Phaeocystis_antarctica.AAC.1
MGPPAKSSCEWLGGWGRVAQGLGLKGWGSRVGAQGATLRHLTVTNMKVSSINIDMTIDDMPTWCTPACPPLDHQIYHRSTLVTFHKLHDRSGQNTGSSGF